MAHRKPVRYFHKIKKALAKPVAHVDDDAAPEIRRNAALDRSIRRGQADARSKRGRFVDR